MNGCLRVSIVKTFTLDMFSSGFTNSLNNNITTWAKNFDRVLLIFTRVFRACICRILVFSSPAKTTKAFHQTEMIQENVQCSKVSEKVQYT
jgi:hypothetical protein